MTLRLTIGIDPGLKGAVAWLTDGTPAGYFDMPTTARVYAGGTAVDGGRLHRQLRDLLTRYQGAAVTVVMELVQGYTGRGASMSFNFGQGDGIVRGVLACLGLEPIEVRPMVWKKHHGLVKPKGGEKPGKGASRTRVVAMFPNQALPYLRAMDDGRAEAVLIAIWALDTDATAGSGVGERKPKARRARARAHVSEASAA